MAVRILIVEDDPNLIVPPQHPIKRHGYDVMVAKELLATLEQERDA